jgi:hypothetical protein
LKKRTKKLLSIWDSSEFTHSNNIPAAIDESFLLLFCKKEALPFLSAVLLGQAPVTFSFLDVRFRWTPLGSAQID